MAFQWMLLALGLALLIVGAELLVRGASRLAAAAGLPSLVIGLTVVAYGTSAPELAVSLQAGLAGSADIALGNVVGSNIFNVLFILGVSALVAPLTVASKLVRLDLPILVVVSAAVIVLGRDGRIGQLEGAVLAIAGILYTVFLIRQGHREGRPAEDGGPPPSDPGRVWPGALALVAVGLALLVLGARWLVEGAVAVARGAGVSELVIGLTLVAAGTSLPEVATSVVASLRGERDIAVGNVVGSNLFNILWVLGLASAVSPAGVGVAAAALRFDLPVMLAVAVACLPVFFTGWVIARWEGALFLGYYLAYVAFLLLASSQHAALPVFNAVMLRFVLPLTAITLLVLTAGWLRTLRRARRTHGG